MNYEIEKAYRLGTLCHLDLQVGGVRQVDAADAEASGGDLLDGRARAGRLGRVVVEQAGQVLAALAGVRLAADFVHRFGERGVRLDGDAAEAHGAGGEALDNARGRLDLVHADADGVRVVDLELAANGAVAVGLGVQRGELLVRVAAVGLRGELERGDGARIVDVLLARVAPMVDARVDGELVVAALARSVGKQVAVVGLRRQDLEVDAGEARRRALEAAIDDLAVHAHRLEDLRALVRLQRADAHLGHHLGHAVARRRRVVGKYALVIEVVVQHPLRKIKYN